MSDFFYFSWYFVFAALIVNRRHGNRIRAALRVNHAIASYYAGWAVA